MQVNLSTTYSLGAGTLPEQFNIVRCHMPPLIHNQTNLPLSEAMAYRGDLIACEVDFGGVRNGKLPVMFFLNGREIARAWTNSISGERKVFPFISMAYEGIRVLAKV